MAASNREAQEAALTGLLLVGLGLLCNEWLLAWAFSPDGVLSPPVKVQIRAFEGVLIGIGALYLACSRYFAGRPGVLQMLVLKAGAALFLVAALEITFVGLNARRAAALLMERDPLLRFSEALGYAHLPGVRVSSVNKIRGRTLFDATYSIDDRGRRVVPAAATDALRERFALFFGGSFTFGYGVDDDETLPHYFAGYAPAYRPYNYGVLGYGPQQMLVQLRSGTLAQEVAEPAGAAVFVFMPDQVREAIGSMRNVTQGARHFPCFALDGQGQPVVQGSFLTAWPNRMRLYGWLCEEPILKYHRVDWPVRVADRHFAFTARLVEASRDAFREQFGSEAFYVVIWPRAPGDEFAGARIRPWLEAAGVRVLDYSDLVDVREPGYLLDAVADQHPTPKTYAVVAAALARDLAGAAEFR